MAHHISAKKRIKTNLKSAKRNVHYKSTMKTAIKKVLTAPSKEVAAVELPKTVALLDRLVSKGIIHKNKAAHQKSRLAKRVNAL